MRWMVACCVYMRSPVRVSNPEDCMCKIWVGRWYVNMLVHECVAHGDGSSYNILGYGAC